MFRSLIIPTMFLSASASMLEGTTATSRLKEFAMSRIERGTMISQETHRALTESANITSGSIVYADCNTTNAEECSGEVWGAIGYIIGECNGFTAGEFLSLTSLKYKKYYYCLNMYMH